MVSKRELRARLDAANATIERLRVRLCGSSHDWVEVERLPCETSVIGYETVYECSVCGKRKVGL